MKKRNVLLVLVCVLCVVAVVAMFASSRVNREPTDGERAQAMLDRLENALGNEWTKQSQSEILPIVYEDSQGETIIYYICKTTYTDGEIPEISELDSILDEIIDPDTAEKRRECKVCDLDAMLYQKNGRAYLCWTVSAEYSLAIEYNPETVTEADIFKMAESIPANAEC